jgi:hypothetical protein
MSVKIPTQIATTPISKVRRKKFYVSSLMVRVLIALIISWLIVMAFFITNVASR